MKKQAVLKHVVVKGVVFVNESHCSSTYKYLFLASINTLELIPRNKIIFLAIQYAWAGLSLSKGQLMMTQRSTAKFYIRFLLVVMLIAGCTPDQSDIKIEIDQPVDREAKIPPDAVKIFPETDAHPPQLHSSEFEQPIPIPGMVNTAGGEDSPFISEDGNTLYFFFTPQVAVPAEKQILDGVTGIYVSQKVNGQWNRPQRIWLQEPGKLAGDGCEFVLGSRMWFCSAREGFTGFHWFTADFKDGRWQNWQLADFPEAYQVGELHISADGKQLYFHSARPGGKGNLDIWVSTLENGKWQEPVNLEAVNTPDLEGWPALNPGETELWFYRNYSIFRSKKVNGLWQPPEVILSSLAGEPTLDAEGNLYFTHHFYKDNKMIEADIYVAFRKK